MAKSGIQILLLVAVAFGDIMLYNPSRNMIVDQIPGADPPSPEHQVFHFLRESGSRLMHQRELLHQLLYRINEIKVENDVKKNSKFAALDLYKNHDWNVTK